jgi:hypothetical protein
MVKKKQSIRHVEFAPSRRYNNYAEVATWPDGEFDVVVTRMIDDYPDLSWLGAFSNTPKEGAIDHHEHTGDARAYRYFNPGNTYADASPRMRKKYIEADYVRLRSYGDAWHMTTLLVEIKLAGHVIAEDSLGGVPNDDDGKYVDERIDEMVASALDEARKNVLRLAKKALTLADDL